MNCLISLAEEDDIKVSAAFKASRVVTVGCEELNNVNPRMRRCFFNMFAIIP